MSQPQPTMITRSNGTKEWYLNNGKCHRENGPAVECSDGYRAWYLNGLRHRTNGPAIERPDGYKEWWISGLRHREDGPALERPDGSKAWYLNNKKVTFKEVFDQAPQEVKERLVFYLLDNHEAILKKI